MTTDIANGVNSTGVCVLVLINPTENYGWYEFLRNFRVSVKKCEALIRSVEEWNVNLLDVISSLLLCDSCDSELETVH